jgi:hypothetical protein
MKVSAGWGSHLPVLSRVIQITEGPVLELGVGLFSTPFLHWMCQDKGLQLESFEKHESYYNIFHSRHRSMTFENKNHKITLVADWDKADIDRHWGMVFIDHDAERRKIEAIRMANQADYVVLHDTQEGVMEDEVFGISEVASHYKYRKDFNQFRPRTTVFSNFKDLSKL